MKFCECGCGNPAPIASMTNKRKGWIKGHPLRFIHGHHARIAPPRYNGGRSKTWSGYIEIRAKDHPRATRRGYVREHILVAEKAIGRYLPIVAEVHHVNGVKDDNRTTNLVICENASYHTLLHARMKAYRATGNPDARQCRFCHQYDISLSSHRGGGHHHLACASRYNRDRRKQRNEEAST